MASKFGGIAAALLLVAAGAQAQDVSTAATAAASGPEFGLANQVDFGLRGTIFGDNADQARYQRYRDLRDGGTVDLFRFSKQTDAYRFDFQGNHLGYRDQRYTASYNNYGKVKASFEWNQIPLNYSYTTQSLYTTAAPGVLVLPDAVQSGVQNRTLTLGSAVGGASVFDLQSKRSIADFKLTYSATPMVDFGVTFRNTLREGTQPYGATFGFGDAVEVPLPLDNRTTELGASLQWAGNRGLAKVAYDGSFFRNNVSSLSWDNPLRITDSATAGPLFGRMALSPNTDMNTASAIGSLKLPGRSRATAYLAVSNLTNNTALIPFTTNTTLPTIALDRPTADLTARVTSQNYTFTSSPTSFLWLSARYRGYEYDNRSPEFAVTRSVNYDTAVYSLNESAARLGFTRRTFDGDASVSPFRYVAFRAGYTREEIDHTNPSTGELTRMVDKTAEDTGRVSVDLTNVGWVTLRGVYEHSKRVGTGLDVRTLLDIGEQPSLRQFDIADRNKDSVRGIVQIMPVAAFSVNASVGVGSEEYPGGGFGLRNNDNHVYSIGFDFAPTDAISAGVVYGYEKYTALQASRSASPLPATTPDFLNDPTQSFNDSRRDWTDNSADLVHTWSASCDLLKLIPKTDLRLGYDYSRAESSYVYGVQPNQTLIPVPIQLPAVTNTLQRGTADLRYFLTKHLATGIVYWYDKYAVDDFALGPTASLAMPATGTPTFMMLGYFFRPYTANTIWGRLTYLW
jgi:MtrB/PioB family decaheme-associated outer membrane protein